MYQRFIISIIFCICTLLSSQSTTLVPSPLGRSRCINLGAMRIGGVVQDRNGMIWVCTWSGLYCYDGYELHSVRVSPGDGTSIGGDHIRDIRLSPQGDIWCRTDDEIFKFDIASFSFRDLPPREQKRIAPLMGRTWHGTTDRQSIRWTADGSTLLKTITHSHHPARTLGGTEGLRARSLFTDREGRIWAGFKDSNLIKVYDRNLSLIKTIAMDFQPYCIYQMRNGNVWAGGKPSGLARVGDEGSICTDAVYDMKEDARGRLWIASFGGGVKCCADPGAQHPVLSPTLGGRYVKKLLITPSGHLIAATTEGLLTGSVNGASLTRIALKTVKRDGNNPRSLASNAILDVKEDSRGNIYVCTESHGIDMTTEEELFSANPSFRHLGHGGSAMTNDVCNAIALAGDSLLVVTGSDNVTFYYPKKDEAVNYARTFWGDSCTFSEASAVLTADGSWLFCTLTGVLVATPHHLYSRGFAPHIFFTTLAVNGGADIFTPLADTLRLSAGQRNISLRYAAIDNISNQEISYRSSFDGSAWSVATRSRSITLYDLSAGSHILRVQSTDRYGRWVDNCRTLLITVAPYWYETWWAMALFAVLALLVCSTVAYAFIYIRRMKQQRNVLLHQLMEMIDREKELSARMAKEEATAPAQAQERGNEDAMERTLSDMTSTGARPEDIRFLGKVKDYIERNIGNASASIEEMAAEAAVSRSTLNRRLQKLVGVSAKQLLLEARMKRAERLLATEQLPIDCIARMCGYDDVAYFKKVMKKKKQRIS